MVHGRRRRPGPVVVALSLIAVAVAGCADLLWIPQEEPIAEEDMPMWAGIEVVGDPEVAERPIQLELRTIPELERIRSIDFEPGTTVRWQEGVGEGPFRLAAFDGACHLDVDLPPEQVVRYVLRVEADACSFAPAGPGAIPLPEGAWLAVTVTAQPWAGLLVEVVSLDTPTNPVPPLTPPDEGGLAQLSPVYPGTYEVRLLRDGVVLESMPLTVGPVEPATSSIQLTMDGVPD